MDHSFSSRRTGLPAATIRDQFHNLGIFDPKNILTYADQADILSQNALMQETHIFRLGTAQRLSSELGARELSPRSAQRGAESQRLRREYLSAASEGHRAASASRGFFNFGDNANARFTRKNYTLSDDVRWVKGRHSYSFGGTAEISRVDLDNQFYSNSQMTFTSDVTNYAIASLLIGRVQSFRQGAGEFKNNRNQFIGFYAQDNFRVNEPAHFESRSSAGNRCSRGGRSAGAWSSSMFRRSTPALAPASTRMRLRDCCFRAIRACRNGAPSRCTRASSRESALPTTYSGNGKTSHARRRWRFLRLPSVRNLQQPHRGRDSFQPAADVYTGAWAVQRSVTRQRRGNPFPAPFPAPKECGFPARLFWRSRMNRPAV